MRTSPSVVIVSIALLISACGADVVAYRKAEPAPAPEAAVDARQEIAQAVGRAAGAHLEQGGAPGVQVAVRVAGAYHAGAYGHRDNKRSESARIDDVYRIGSVTKTFTAVVILSLVQEGRLSLDDCIGRWIDLPNAYDVTVRRLLNHTSGIPNYSERTLPSLGTILRPRYLWRPDQLTALVRRQGLLFEPGTRHSYSNTNYVALGIIAEAVTDRGIDELYRERIIEPAGLRDTFFLPYEQGPDPDRLVVGYERDLLPFATQPITPHNLSWLTYGYAAGAMVSSAPDLARFVDALFEGILLEPPALAAMTRFIAAPHPRIPAQTGYGFGLRRLEMDGTVLLGHTGTIPGFGAIVMHAPGADCTIAAVGNLSRLDSLGLMKAILTELGRTNTWQAR